MKLNPAKDALASERCDSLAAQTYANIVAVRKEDLDRREIREQIAALQSPEIRAFIATRYSGAVVPVK